MKREDYISWDEYFMGIAALAAKRSKDPNTQVGACIVSTDDVILSTGYNGMPKGCPNLYPNTLTLTEFQRMNFVEFSSL